MTIVPTPFYDKACAREYLAQVVDISENEAVHSVHLSAFDSYFIYAGEEKPALLACLGDLLSIKEYNKILCHWDGSALSLCIAQGKSLLLANTYHTSDFVGVMYFVILALKSLQLNPEVSTIYFRSPLSSERQVMLYHYFMEVKSL